MSGLLLGVGLVLLLSGGFALVHGASQLARRLGVPAVIVGLTVVAFGTSAPELAVNVLAALRGDPEISFGNVIGSNLANLGLILGLVALLAPLSIASVVLLREIPMMLLATAAAVALALDHLLRGQAEAYDRTDGIILLLFFTVFLYTATMMVLRRREGDELVRQSAEVMSRPLSVPRSGALIIAGLTALIAGAELTVSGAVAIAGALGVPTAIIGRSVVAVGTSLPELVSSIIAAVRGESDLAVGNVVGSNIFNLLFIMGVTATIGSVPLPAGGLFDLIALAALSILLFVFAATGRRLARWEGVVLLGGWLAFALWRLLPPG